MSHSASNVREISGEKGEKFPPCKQARWTWSPACVKWCRFYAVEGRDLMSETFQFMHFKWLGAAARGSYFRHGVSSDSSASLLGVSGINTLFLSRSKYEKHGIQEAPGANLLPRARASERAERLESAVWVPRRSKACGVNVH